jgi:hypothetical protein
MTVLNRAVLAIAIISLFINTFIGDPIADFPFIKKTLPVPKRPSVF